MNRDSTGTIQINRIHPWIVIQLERFRLIVNESNLLESDSFLRFIWIGSESRLGDSWFGTPLILTPRWKGLIVYYIIREVNSWPVQSTCKLTPEPKALYHHVAYTIFHHTRAENTTFAFRSRERKWYFRPGYGVKKISKLSPVVGLQEIGLGNWGSLKMKCYTIIEFN